MEELKKQLKEKRDLMSSLRREIWELENKIMALEWAGKPECEHTQEDIRDGKCPYGDIWKGQIYCKNINCHK